MTDTAAPNKYALLVSEADLQDGLPPREAYVGKIMGWEIREHHWDDRDNPGQKTTRLGFVLIVDPLTTAIATTDGMDYIDYPMPAKQDAKILQRRSVYGICMEMLTTVWAETKTPEEIAELLSRVDEKGNPTHLRRDDKGILRMVNADIYLGATLVFAGKNKDSFGMGDYNPKKHFTTAVGIPPTNWQDRVPANLTEQKLTAMARAKARADAAALAAGSVNGSSVQGVDLGSFGASTTSTAVDLGEHEASVVEALVGQSDETLINAIGRNKALKELVGPAIIQAIYSTTVPQDLIRRGVLTQDAKGVYQRA